MELSTLAPLKGARKSRKRIGRGNGSGTGKTSGKGHKGQKARSGGKVRRGFEGGQMPLYRRIPKIGFTSRKRVLGTNQYNLVNFAVLNRFEDGATVDADSLKALGYRARASKKAGYKVLGGGADELTKKLTVRVQAISGAAKQAIEAKGGTVEILELAKPEAEKKAEA